MTDLDRAYREALESGRADTVREEPQPTNELAWQARWFSGACGREFATADGESVEIVGFGAWNREAGPDFVGCTARIAGVERHGAIEVDLDATGWEQHRHATNPDYESVVLHVVVRRPSRRYFSRTASQRNVPQVCLADFQAARPEWESAAPAHPGKCVGPLHELPRERLLELLAVAARRRADRKAAELSAMMRARGTDATLYEALAVTLGYKSNQLPFRLLAQRVPHSAAAKPRGEALLFGLAGFLERPEPPPGPAREEAAALWASWWRQRAACASAILPRAAWKLSGIRPANHPLRRLGALAAIARQWRAVRAALESASPDALEDVLGRLEHPFWSFHTTWTSPKRATPMALLGPDRIREIYANVSLPLARARGETPPWENLAAGPPNATLRVVSARLFGGALPASLPRRLYVHQGLLQIHADFCQSCLGDCARCRFPGLVGRLSA